MIVSLFIIYTFMLFFLGRILLGSFFITNGVQQLANIKKYVKYAKSKGVWYPEKLVPIAAYLLIISGLGIIAWIPFLWISTTFLIPFLIIVNIKMHAFWKLEGDEKDKEFLFFMYNCALIGALLIFIN